MLVLESKNWKDDKNVVVAVADVATSAAAVVVVDVGKEEGDLILMDDREVFVVLVGL